jgi:hypothetical protein
LLTYRSWWSELLVQIDGQTIPPVVPAPTRGPTPLGFSPSPTNLAYNISQFAGREVSLAFAGPFGLTNAFTGDLGALAYIDSIQFVTDCPPLQVTRSGNQLLLSWPAATVGYLLQTTAQLSPDAFWQTVTNAPVVVGDRQSVTVMVGDKSQFYRLSLSRGG